MTKVLPQARLLLNMCLFKLKLNKMYRIVNS